MMMTIPSTKAKVWEDLGWERSIDRGWQKADLNILSLGVDRDLIMMLGEDDSVLVHYHSDDGDNSQDVDAGGKGGNRNVGDWYPS